MAGFAGGSSRRVPLRHLFTWVSYARTGHALVLNTTTHQFSIRQKRVFQVGGRCILEAAHWMRMLPEWSCFHALIQVNAGPLSAAAAKSHQSCPTLCDPIGSSPPGSHPWDSPGKNTGVGCHFLLQCMKVKVRLLSHVRLFATPWMVAYQAP